MASNTGRMAPPGYPTLRVTHVRILAEERGGKQHHDSNVHMCLTLCLSIIS